MEDEVVSRQGCCGCKTDEELGDGACSRTTNRTDKMKASLISRLNRIEGQIRGIRGMVEKDIYCDDILNQIAAVQSAMKGVGKLLLESHMKSCLITRVRAGETEVVDELLCTIEKLLK